MKLKGHMERVYASFCCCFLSCCHCCLFYLKYKRIFWKAHSALCTVQIVCSEKVTSSNCAITCEFMLFIMLFRHLFVLIARLLSAKENSKETKVFKFSISLIFGLR